MKLVLVGLLAVVAASLILNLVGLDWGQPAIYSWHTDSVAGLRTVRHLPALFGKWENKYPRVHFMVVGLFYKPLLNHWEKNPVTVIYRDGRVTKSTLDTNRISTLIILSRIISAIMGTGTVIAVFFTTRQIFKDSTAAIFSALALSCSMLFVFYCHLGNLDVPATFWFAWCCYWAVKATLVGKWRHFILLGLFCSLAICTKDPLAGYAIGLGLAVWLAMIGKALSEGKSWLESATSILSWKTLVAVIVAFVCFGLFNNLFTLPKAFFQRMSHWIGGSGVENYNKTFVGQGVLLYQALKNIYYSLGWPLLLVIALSTIYCTIRYSWKVGFGIAPIVVFYIVVVINVRMTVPRYFLPGFVGLAILLGKGCSDLLAAKKIPKIISLVIIILLFTTSLLYCIGLDAELLTDSRYRAEQWCVENIDKNAHIVTLSGIYRAPRLYIKGFSRFEPRWEKPRQTIRLLTKQPVPEYIIMSSFAYRRASFDKDFIGALFDGSLGYTEIAHFDNKFLCPKRTILGFAGWPLEKQTYISPELTILKRNTN